VGGPRIGDGGAVIDGLVEAIASGSVDTRSIDLVDPREVPWDRVARSAYLIDQELRYRYEGPIRDLQHRLVVIPPDVHGDQCRVDYRFSVDSASAPGLTSRCDVHGNLLVDIAVDRIEEEISFRAVITVTRRPGRTSHPIPRSQVDRYRAPSRLTRPDGELERAAGRLRRVCRDRLKLANAINEWVHATMRYEYGITHVGTTAAEALALGRGVCQDHAHVMLALCRLCGLPARYVSGHLLGEGGTHAWVEVLLPDGSGESVAHAFDPTHGCATGPGYLTVAVGRDYDDVPPTSGSYRSGFAGTLTTRKRAGIVALEYAA
jgi:transglutaminase-like putative cysteine protease